MICPNCSFDNLPNASYCEDCGINLEKPFTPPPHEEEQNGRKCSFVTFLGNFNTRLREIKTRHSRLIPRNSSKLILEELSQIAVWYVFRLMPKSPVRVIEFLKTPAGLVIMMVFTYVWCLVTDDKPPERKLQEFMKEETPIL